MVSITFDEFHALRTRQRAAAEAADASKRPVSAITGGPTLSSSTSDRSSMTRVTDTPIDSSFDGKSGRSDSALGKMTSASSRGDGGDDGDAPLVEVAPTSGSHAHMGASWSKGCRPLNVEARMEDDVCRKEPVKRRAERILGATSLGHFVELYEVQLAMVVLIFLDLVASTAQLLPSMQHQEQRPTNRDPIGEGEGEDTGSAIAGGWLRFALRLLQSLTGFTVIFFGFEVAALLVAFRGKVFRHAGYVVDLIVVSLCLYHELAGSGKEIRLLGALRMWRVARLINTLLLAADESHNKTRVTLRREEKRTLELETDQRRLHETLRREMEARKRVDKMLRGFKDEVETLNEALKIAAMDIAEARVSGGSGLGSVVSETLLDKAKEERGSSAASSDVGVATDVAGSEDPGEGRYLSPSSSSTVSTGQIFVFQDGTFQAR